MMYEDTYIETVLATIKSAWETQKEQTKAASSAICAAVQNHSSVFVFGCSHAGILAEEVFYRTGGLAVINPIFFSGLMLNTRPITATSSLEKLNGLAEILLEKNHVGAGDVLIIHSVSGRNNVPVEMALGAKKRGATVIGITSLAYSGSVTSRHKSGKRLFECCDIVLDNKGVPGDAAITIPGLSQPCGPTSTACGATLLNAVIVGAISQMVEKGMYPPVFMSANLDGGEAYNRKIFETYQDQIFYE